MNPSDRELVERLRTGTVVQDYGDGKQLIECAPAIQEKAADAIERLSKDNERLVEALEKIRDDDARDGNHPCDPKSYGHFGTVARTALQLHKEKVSDEPLA